MAYIIMGVAYGNKDNREATYRRVKRKLHNKYITSQHSDTITFKINISYIINTIY